MALALVVSQTTASELLFAASPDPASPVKTSSSFDLDSAEICWRDTATRGVGLIPTECAGDQDAGLCYPRCPAGFTGIGPVCWQNCPPEFTDTGGHCLKPAPYGRGAGYPWQFGDALDDSAMFARCRAANPQGCEKSGLIVYPKCRAGFHAEGCCVCSPDCPAGMLDIGVSCQKQSSARGVGSTLSCSAGLVYDAGLCYPACPPGTNGVGPVCWGSCPAAFPVDCAASCAKTTDACAKGVSSQVLTPLEVVQNIVAAVVTGGGSAGAKVAGQAAAKTAATAAVKATIKQQLIQKAKQLGKELAEAAAESAASTLAEAQATGEFDFTGLDPTGVTAVVDAYYKPVCADAVRRNAAASLPSAAAALPAAVPAASCSDAVQGRLVWDHASNRSWGADNLRRLCGNATNAEPARCFERVMSGSVSWGGGTRWEWSNAITLCSGVQNADAVIACFQTRLQAGEPWTTAAANCRP